MIFLDLFKRRNIGPLSVSPLGLASFCLVAAAAAVIAKGVYQDKEIQTHLHAAMVYARPIAEQVRLMQERTGTWPASLTGIEAAKTKAPPQVGRTLLLRDGEVRVVFASPPAIANATLTLRVIVRGGEHMLECRGEGEFTGALPSACRPGEGPARLTWPPEASISTGIGAP